MIFSFTPHQGLAITNVTTLHLISLNAQIHSELDLDEWATF